MGDDAFIRVIFRVENQAPGRSVYITFGRRYPIDHGVQYFFGSGAVFGRDIENLVVSKSEGLLNLAGDPFRFGLWEIYLVQDWNQFKVIFHGQQCVGDGLSFDALTGVNHQQRTFAGCQCTGHLIAEVNVARRVDEVELVHLAVRGGVRHRHSLSLDGYASFPF